jgi:phosphoribosylglycinamide formyltransferase-1
VQIGVLASGSGTVCEAVLDAGLPVRLVLTDRDCPALVLAAARGVDTVLVPRTFDSSFDRDGYTDAVVQQLRHHGVELVVMAGFGTVLGPALFAAYGPRVLNTHPSLLPAFPGWHAVRDALAYGVRITGCTVHVATAEVDHGPILCQVAVPVEPGDDEMTLHERIKTEERRAYVQTIRDILERGTVQ